MKTIDDFRDPNFSWLLNSHPSDVVFDGETYRTLEHAFQAAKTDDQDDRTKIRFADSARKARQIGRRMSIHQNWDAERVNVMRQLLESKFQAPDLRQKLLATKSAKLESGGHKFWGLVKGQGDNLLGKLLMELRASILQKNSEALDEACRDYLASCHWERDTNGDGLFGECWTPPWDADCQYLLIEAVSEQRKQVVLPDLDDDDLDSEDDDLDSDDVDVSYYI